ncbi:hypothetical protein QMO56_04965 [Roseomonas sp. E05]|uniref:hypothetical protein n=1 Tax=Roseomonas sp. E05 TaxID=3046310 RepID=UPI0024BA2DF5|nr:hypothetical protein [Roseomonas sp. E05]MDJ0387455.1 hypothetical protein [Roseomonas sp. E05]
MTVNRIVATTALATTLALGGFGLAHAQAVNPDQPGSASGGLRASANPSGTGTGAALPGNAKNTGAPAAGGKAQHANAAMSKDQVRNALHARGYSDISGLEREGDSFKLDEARRFGAEVEDLRVDASTGKVRDEKRLSEDQARNLLKQRGYSDVSEVKREGDTISAKARRNDRQVQLRIDARSGDVTQQQASN